MRRFHISIDFYESGSEFLELGTPSAYVIVLISAHREQGHTQFSTTPAVSSNGLEPWVLVTQGIESRHRLRGGSVPSARYLRNSGLVFVVHSARTRPSGTPPCRARFVQLGLTCILLAVLPGSWTVASLDPGICRFSFLSLVPNPSACRRLFVFT